MNSKEISMLECSRILQACTFWHAASSSPSLVTFLWPLAQDIHLELISHRLAVNLSAFPLTCIEN